MVFVDSGWLGFYLGYGLRAFDGGSFEGSGDVMFASVRTSRGQYHGRGILVGV